MDDRKSFEETAKGEILPNGIDINNLGKAIDYTVLKPGTTRETLEKFCKEAIE